MTHHKNKNQEPATLACSNLACRNSGLYIWVCVVCVLECLTMEAVPGADAAAAAVAAAAADAREKKEAELAAARKAQVSECLLGVATHAFSA